MPRDARFSDHQRFHWWIWFLVSPAVIMAWFGFVQQIMLGIPYGTNPAPDVALWIIFILIGIFLPFFMWKAGLVIEVKDDALHYRWRPFVKRRIPGSAIAGAEARTYRPIRDYGGWGVKYGGPSKGWSYSTSGNRGVFVTCVDGRCFLLGTDRPEELVEALSSIMADR